MTTSHGRLIVVMVLVLALLTACAAGANPSATQSAPSAGFWLGLWHGLIAPVTFVISLFTDQVNMYEVRNNGNWYDFGFVFGLLVSFGGPASSSAAVSRRSSAVSGSNKPVRKARHPDHWQPRTPSKPDIEPTGPGEPGR